MSRLPEGFYVGAATAAHQVEGNNTHSDYWAMEQMENTSFNEPSLDAVDHYNRYEEDIKLMADAGLNAYLSPSSGRGSSRSRASLTRRKSSTTARCWSAAMPMG